MSDGDEKKNRNNKHIVYVQYTHTHTHGSVSYYVSAVCNSNDRYY